MHFILALIGSISVAPAAAASTSAASTSAASTSVADRSAVEPAEEAATAELVRVLPGAPLVIGQPGTVELWAPALSGDARLRGRSDLARVGAATAAGDGRWMLPVTPTAAGSEHITVLLSLKDGERRAEWSVSVPVRAATAGALQVDVGAGAVVWGEEHAREIPVHPLGSSPLPIEQRRLLARSRLGNIGPVKLGDDGWVLPWRAPRTLDGPAWEIITVADATAPTAVLGWAALPLSYPTVVTAEVPPGARCALSVGTRPGAPALADEKGHVELALDLLPGVARGELRCEVGEEELLRTLALPGATGPTVALLPLPSRLPAGAAVPVQAVVIEDDGAPRTAGSSPIVEGAGELSLVAAGVYSGTWAVPDKHGRHEIRATLRDSADQTDVEIVAPGSISSLPTARVAAWAQPAAVARATVDTGRSSVVVLASALDAVGLPVPGARFEATPHQAHMRSSKVVAGRDGRAAVRLYLEPGDALPSLRLASGGFSDTAVVIIDDKAPATTAGTGPDTLRQARAALAAGGSAKPDLPPANGSTSRAAAGDAQAIARVDSSPTHAARQAPWLRLAMAAGTVPHAWRQSAIEGDQGIPGKVTSRQGDLFAGDPLGAFGADLRLQVEPPTLPVGFDLRLQARPEHYVVVGTDFERVDLQIAAGLRAPVALGSRATPFVVAQAVGFRVPLFSYDYFRQDEPSKAAGARMLTTTVIGGRLGGGVDIELGDVLVDLELSETFAPWPIDTRAGAAIETAVIDQLALRAAVDLSFRSMEFDLGADRAQVFDEQHQLLLGLVYLAR